MLGSTLALCLASAAVLEEPPATVQVQLGVQTGILFGDEDRARPVTLGVPAVLGGHLGLRAWRRPLATGGGAITIVLGAEGRHAFHASKTEWLGRVGVGADLWRVIVLLSGGFGFSWMPTAGLRPILPVTASLMLRLPGPMSGLVVGLSYERMFQFVSFSDLQSRNRLAALDSRVLISITKDFDLTD